MRDYAQSRSTFWTGETGRAMRGDPELQVTAHYLFTSTHSTMTGVYHLPMLYIAHETGLSSAAVERTMGLLQELDYCLYDPTNEHVWVKEMARFQIAADLKPTDNRVKSITAEYQRMPAGLLREGFFDRYGSVYHLDRAVPEKPKRKTPQAPSKGLRRGFEGASEGSETSTKPLRSQEQEQEQEQEHEQDRAKARAAPGLPASSGEPAAPESTAPLAKAEIDLTERICREALGEIAPVDPVIGPMALLVQDGIALERVGLVLRSEARRPRKKPIRTWKMWADIVRERLQEAGPSPPAVAAASEPRIDFGGGFSAPESMIRKVQERGQWIDEWGPKPGQRGCRVPERLWLSPAAA